MSPINLAIVGVGKIVRDQHLPAVAKNGDYRLIAAASRHGTVEELYVVLSGSGTLKLDDELVELSPMDVVRIGPAVAHGMEAGPDGLEVLAFGPLGDGDAEIVEGLWEDPEG